MPRDRKLNDTICRSKNDGVYPDVLVCKVDHSVSPVSRPNIHITTVNVNG